MKWLIILLSLLTIIIPLEFSPNNDLINKINDISNQLFLNHNKYSSLSTLDSIKQLTNSLFESLNLFVKKDSTIRALNQCRDSLYSLYTNESIHRFYDLFTYSGKGLSDIGFESECLSLNFDYFKVLYTLSLDQFSIKDEVEVMRFLNQSTFYTGFCVIKECREAINSIKENDNETLFSYLELHYHLTNISFLYPPDQPYSPSDPLLSVFIIFIYCILGLFCFKLIITVIKIACFSSYNNQSNGTNANIALEDEEDDSMQHNLSDSDDNDNNGNSGNKKGKGSQSMKQQEDLIFKHRPMNDANKALFRNSAQSLLLRFINFFDIFENISYLSSLSNKYYTDKRIALFTFVRFLLMFSLTYNHNFFTLTRMPGKDFLNSDFYKSILFCFIKLSIHSTSLWVILDGAIFSFKFMSSIKNDMRKSNAKSISLTFILRWWLLTIPKTIIFVFIFFFFHFFISHYKYFFSNTGTMFEYYLSLFQSRQCKDNPVELLIPFSMSYKDSSESFTYCYRFCYIYFNEMYLFIVFTIYFYISLKLKSKILDYLVLALTVLNIALTTLSLPFYSSSFLYHIDSIFGRCLSEKYLHLFFNFYTMGIFIGMSYFYYYDAVSTYSLTQKEIYVPFCFCYSFVKFFDTMKYIYKKVLLSFLFFLIFLDSLSFFFVRLVRQTEHNSLLFPIDAFMNIFDQYDKILVGITFSIVLVLLLLFPKETTIRNVINSNLFTSFSRISFAYYCLSNTIIYVLYCVFTIQLKLTYPNLIYVTLGLLLINSFISLIVVIMLELPFRVLIKKLIRWSGNRKANIEEDKDKLLIEQINNSMRIIDE